MSFVTHRTYPFTRANIRAHSRRFVINKQKYLLFVRDIASFLFSITLYLVVQKSPARGLHSCGKHDKQTDATDERFKTCCFFLITFIWSSEMRGNFILFLASSEWWNLKHMENLENWTKHWHSGVLKLQWPSSIWKYVLPLNDEFHLHTHTHTHTHTHKFSLCQWSSTFFFLQWGPFSVGCLRASVFQHCKNIASIFVNH